MGRRNKPNGFREEGSNSFSKKNDKFDARLATILLAKGLVTSPEESVCLAESIVAEIEESELSREEACISSMEDYFSMTRKDAKTTLSALLNLSDKENNESGDDNSDDSALGEKASQSSGDEDGVDDDEEEYIGEGECELCERFMKLTAHHLIPKSTWPRILPRLNNAAEALSKHDVHRAGLILGPGLLHLLEPLTIADYDKAAIKGLLRRTCSICRPCHNFVHKSNSNMALATNFSNTQLLLKDEAIYKFCQWANKQKPGKHNL